MEQVEQAVVLHFRNFVFKQLFGWVVVSERTLLLSIFSALLFLQGLESRTFKCYTLQDHISMSYEDLFHQMVCTHALI